MSWAAMKLFFAALGSWLSKAAAFIKRLSACVPGWIWACALAALWLHGCNTRSDLASLQATHAELVSAIEAQKSEAAARLTSLTERAQTAEARFQDIFRRGEIRDQNTLAQLDKARTDLRAVAVHGPGRDRLRDPNAGRPSGDFACAASEPRAEPRDSDRAEASGLLSEQLTQLLFRLSAEADAINTAYESCRSDSRALRAEYEAWRGTAPPD